MLSIFRNKKVVLILCVLFLGIVILGICFGYSFNINQRFVKNMTRDKSLGNANYIAKDEEYEYGVYLSENDSEYIDLQLNINENIENISKNKDTYADEILEKYKEEIEQLMEAAKEKWNL